MSGFYLCLKWDTPFSCYRISGVLYINVKCCWLSVFVTVWTSRGAREMVKGRALNRAALPTCVMFWVSQKLCLERMFCLVEKFEKPLKEMKVHLSRSCDLCPWLPYPVSCMQEGIYSVCRKSEINVLTKAPSNSGSSGSAILTWAFGSVLGLPQSLGNLNTIRWIDWDCPLNVIKPLFEVIHLGVIEVPTSPGGPVNQKGSSMKPAAEGVKMRRWSSDTPSCHSISWYEC